MGQMDRTILEGTISLVSESDYNKLLALIGEKPVELSNNEYYINANYESILPYYEELLKDGHEINLFGKTLKSKGTEV